jgi:adenylate cyclase
VAKEIERKFLVLKDRINLSGKGQRIVQGYIPTADKTAVRIRINGDKAFLTIKGENSGAVRSEFEYAIPLADANAMLEELCLKPFIEKRRHHIALGGHTWELDVFDGDNSGLWVAEIELASETEAFDKPDWVGEEVTGDPKYYNSSLIQNPFRCWQTG